MRQTMIDPSKTASRRDILIGTAATLAVGLPALSLTSGAAAAADSTPTTQKGSVTMSSYITTKDGTEIFYKDRSEEHTSELQSLMRISYAVFCLKNKKKQNKELN